MFAAFTHRSFRLLWVSALAIQLGHWFATLTFQWVLPHSTDADGILLGLLYFCTFTPFLLFSLPAGMLADSRDRRVILLTSQTLAVVLAGTCLALSIIGALPPPVVLLLGFCSGCIIVLVSPANQALTANVVPSADLAGAISLQSVALNLARISGPMLAGPLLLMAGATGAFAVYTAISVLALLLLSRIRTVRPQRPGRAEGVIAQVRAGIEHARMRRPTIAVLGAVALASVFGSGFQAQLPVIGARIARDGNTAFLVLVLATGVGALAGVLLVARMRHLPTLVEICIGLLGLGAVVAAMGAVRSYPVMVGMLVAAGTLIFWVMTCANILIQDLIDDSRRGRVMSLYFLCWGGLLPFGGIGLGGLMSAVGSPLAFAIFGAVAILGGLVILARHRKPAAPLDLGAAETEPAT